MKTAWSHFFYQESYRFINGFYWAISQKKTVIFTEFFTSSCKNNLLLTVAYKYAGMFLIPFFRTLTKLYPYLEKPAIGWSDNFLHVFRTYPHFGCRPKGVKSLKRSYFLNFISNAGQKAGFKTSWVVPIFFRCTALRILRSYPKL